MRRAVGPAWPALSELYGLHPWDVGGDRSLTFRELRIYLDALNQRARETRKQARRTPRRGKGR